MEDHELTLKLRIPITICGNITADDINAIQKYVSNVLNSQERTRDSLGREATGRYCFKGELFRHALNVLRDGIPRCVTNPITVYMMYAPTGDPTKDAEMCAISVLLE